MGQLRKDPVVGRWSIVETEFPSCPDDFKSEGPRTGETSFCPFCYGNEHTTPPEVEAIRGQGTSADTTGWRVRVVPNKFPVLQEGLEVTRCGLGIYDMVNGVGVHEVIVQNPDHVKEIPDLEDKEVEDVIKVCCSRMKKLGKDKRFKYTLLFKNSGSAAGASLAHPHLQLIALPIIPRTPVEEIQGALEYFESNQRCLFCDMIKWEREKKVRVIFENTHFIAFCPFASRFPFEIWVMPKMHQFLFSGISGEQISSLAKALKDVLLKLRIVLFDPPYNFIIHTSPLHQAEDLDHYHWHIEIMPKLTRVAGFERGTGFYIVSTPPELAAEYLRRV